MRRFHLSRWVRAEAVEPTVLQRRLGVPRLAPHPVNSFGQHAACQLPEFPHVDQVPIDFTAAGRGCRPCMAALVALAVNRPEIVGTDRDGRELLAVEGALQTVRDHLDETDPLRVRAEQELVPLCARYAA